MDFDYQRHVFKYPNLLAILEEAIEFSPKRLIGVNLLL